MLTMFSHSFTLLRKGLRPIIAALLFTVLCCGGSKERTVNARGGLYMRQAPRLNAKSVELLPNGAKVQFIEEASQEFTLDGLVGKWTKIKNSKTGSQGWVFGGYLEKPAAILQKNNNARDLSPEDGNREAYYAEGDEFECYELWIHGVLESSQRLAATIRAAREDSRFVQSCRYIAERASSACSGRFALGEIRMRDWHRDLLTDEDENIKGITFVRYFKTSDLALARHSCENEPPQGTIDKKRMRFVLFK